MDIIIYGSLHGAAKRYAEGLAERTGIKAIDYKEVGGHMMMNRHLLHSWTSSWRRKAI